MLAGLLLLVVQAISAHNSTTQLASGGLALDIRAVGLWGCCKTDSVHEVAGYCFVTPAAFLDCKSFEESQSRKHVGANRLCIRHGFLAALGFAESRSRLKKQQARRNSRSRSSKVLGRWLCASLADWTTSSVRRCAKLMRAHEHKPMREWFIF